MNTTKSDVIGDMVKDVMLPDTQLTSTIARLHATANTMEIMLRNESQFHERDLRQMQSNIRFWGKTADFAFLESAGPYFGMSSIENLHGYIAKQIYEAILALNPRGEDEHKVRVDRSYDALRNVMKVRAGLRILYEKFFAKLNQSRLRYEHSTKPALDVSGALQFEKFFGEPAVSPDAVFSGKDVVYSVLQLRAAGTEAQSRLANQILDAADKKYGRLLEKHSAKYDHFRDRLEQQRKWLFGMRTRAFTDKCEERPKF